MKKIFTSFTFGILIIIANAQIDLEHSFDFHSRVQPFLSSSNEIMYCVVTDTNINQIQIYNQDYSLHSATTVARPVGCEMLVYSPSDKIFNLNDDFEFILLFRDANYFSSVVIYDQNGNVIKDFGYYSYQVNPYVYSDGNNCKLFITLYDYSHYPEFKAEIYSLPGCFGNEIVYYKQNIANHPFPNPSNTIIYLPYILENGQSATMTIYNSIGQIIETQTIDSRFNEVVLDVQHYQKGIYTYTYNGNTGKFLVN